jgi:hypothetical protein
LFIEGLIALFLFEEKPLFLWIWGARLFLDRVEADATECEDEEAMLCTSKSCYTGMH